MYVFMLYNNYIDVVSLYNYNVHDFYKHRLVPYNNHSNAINTRMGFRTKLNCYVLYLALQGTFSSSIAVLLSMLGSVVGTGNIWRFPRIVANHSSGGGKELKESCCCNIILYSQVLWCF